MLTKLQNPWVGAVGGLLISVGLGALACVRALVPILEQSLVQVAPQAPEESKHRGWDFWTIEIENLSNALKEDRAKLRRQMEQVDLRSSRLAAEEKELAKVRIELEQLRAEIARQVTEIGVDEMKNLRMLAQTYSNLTPRAVMGVFKELDDATAVKILSLMKAEVVGPIFEEMAKAPTADGAMARRVAALSEKLRLMKNTRPAGSG